VEEAARAAIFDVAGVPTFDTPMAHHLLQTTAMIRLLGARTILTGLSAEAAKTMVHLGVDRSTMETTSQLVEGRTLAMTSR
jgi:rsbT co-antagonist protein RsbR